MREKHTDLQGCVVRGGLAIQMVYFRVWLELDGSVVASSGRTAAGWSLALPGVPLRPLVVVVVGAQAVGRRRGRGWDGRDGMCSAGAGCGDVYL